MKEWEYTPAKDHGLSPHDALKSTWREPGLISSLFHTIWLTVCQVYFKTYHRLTVRDSGFFPQAGPFVVVANHCSHLDAPAVISSLPRKLRPVAYPLAAGDAFFSTTRGAWFGALFLNALPVWRKRSARHSLGDLRNRLEKRNVVFILFPEGTRSRDGEMGAFKPGVGMLVAGSTVPVVPCHIEGTFRSLPPGAKWPKRSPLAVTVSEPVTFPDQNHDREGWISIANRLAQRIKDLEPSPVDSV